MDVEKIRLDFPITQKYIYLDNACMSLRPKQVIDAINDYYYNFPACGERSHHKLSNMVNERVEQSRKAIKEFFSAKKPEEIVFTKNTTESINLVANTFGLQKGDEVILTKKEHNSNLLPFLKLQKEKGIVLKFVDFDNEFDLEAFKQAITNKTKLVSMVHTSNMDGTSIPAKEIIKIAHDNKAKILLDCAQAAPHIELNVKKLDVDFLACSGHKMLGPGGIGILYGKEDLLEELNTFIIGGDTVEDSKLTDYQLMKSPNKFEAGLQHYPGIIGMKAAVDYLKRVGLDNIHKHIVQLNKHLTELTSDMPIEIFGPKDAEKRSGIFSFSIKGMHPHEAALMLSNNSICLRSGAHCVHSWFNEHNSPGSIRASLYLYNTKEEVETFKDKLKELVKLSK